jgi:hypothetical protein
MTEAEWWSSTRLEPMLAHPTSGWKYNLVETARGLGIRIRSSKDRKLRLFTCACFWSVWKVWECLAAYDSGRMRNAVEVAERYVDGEVKGSFSVPERHTNGQYGNAMRWH